ncbi:MAG TPA: right-handed parallel beta-helix repeat-containing protein [Pyrinomonadaceae bacterium]|jgi:hypothetical protein
MKLQFTLKSFALAAFLLAMTSLANAQATRTWVSGVGDDVNPCSRTAPCKTFAGAISKTADKGEIDALDSAGFGAVTLTKSVTIEGNGTIAGILSSGGISGVNVNDGNTVTPGTITVILRNISINGAGSGLHGINYTSGKALVVENCYLTGFASSGLNSHGIRVSLGANGGNIGNLKVFNTTIENVTGDGINVTTAGVQLLMTVNNSRINNCGSDGIEAGANIRGLIRDSVIAHNTTAGVRTSGSNSILNIDNIAVSYSTVGLQASAGSTLNVSNSFIAQNATGVSQNGGTVASFQGNSLVNNTTPGSFSPITQKT